MSTLRTISLNYRFRLGFGHDELHRCPFIFYLAIPPSVFLEVARSIHDFVIPSLTSPLAPQTSSNFRIVVEKPFGHDLHSSDELSIALGKLFREDQVST